MQCKRIKTSATCVLCCISLYHVASFLTAGFWWSLLFSGQRADEFGLCAVELELPAAGHFRKSLILLDLLFFFDFISEKLCKRFITCRIKTELIKPAGPHACMHYWTSLQVTWLTENTTWCSDDVTSAIILLHILINIDTFLF